MFFFVPPEGYQGAVLAQQQIDTARQNVVLSQADIEREAKRLVHMWQDHARKFNIPIQPAEPVFQSYSHWGMFADER